MQKIQNGAIPISPFIHDAEKRIMRATMDLGYPLIKLTDCGFEDRFKPRGRISIYAPKGRCSCLLRGRKISAGNPLPATPNSTRLTTWPLWSPLFLPALPLHNCAVIFFAVCRIIANFAGN